MVSNVQATFVGIMAILPIIFLGIVFLTAAFSFYKNGLFQDWFGNDGL